MAVFLGDLSDLLLNDLQNRSGQKGEMLWTG